MLKVNKGGVLYRFAYGHWFGPDCEVHFVDEARNLCQFGRHLAIAPMYWALSLVLFLAKYTIFCLLAFLFGYRPNPEGMSLDNDYFVPIEKMPRIKGQRVVPIVWLVAACVLWWGGQWAIGRLSSAPDIIQAVGGGLWWLIGQTLLLLVYLILAILVLVLFLWVKKQLGELWSVVWGLIKAAKQKVCPFIEFVETKVNSEQIPT